VREEESLWACSRGSAPAASLEPLERRVQRRRQDRERELSQQRSDACSVEAASQATAAALGSTQLCSTYQTHAPEGRQGRSAVQPAAAAAAPVPVTASSVQIDALRQELAAAERTVEELRRMLAEAEGAECHRRAS
jgi:hypothetical protein